MTTPVPPVAVLLDLHSSPAPPPFNHTDHPHNHHPSSPFKVRPLVDLVKKLSAAPNRDKHTSRDVMQVYVMTSSANDNVTVSSAVEQLASGDEGRVHVTLVDSESRIGSFYRAKQQLDDLDVVRVTLVCAGKEATFWTLVCRDLFTPVHQWNVEAVKLGLPPRNTRHRDTLSGRTRASNNSSDGDDGRLQTADCDGEESSSDAAGNSSSVPEDLHADCSDPDIPSPPPPFCTADSVRGEIRTFLRTLPSLLGLPEVQRSPLLPGKGEGFVHGYSTRRGGVTSLGTLCAMNTMYTDKKRDPLLVIEENLRRLSLAGGFDPRTFHIVRVEHGHRVWLVGEEEPPLKYDALVTNRRDVTIAAAGADCVPLLFADPVNMVIGAAHAGWLGSVQRVAQCVVQAMTERFGSRPENVRVAMGPGLRLGCFQVLKEEGEMFTAIHPHCAPDSVEPVLDVGRGGGGRGRGRRGGGGGGGGVRHDIVDLHHHHHHDDEDGSLPENTTTTTTTAGNPELRALRVEQVPADLLKAKTPRSQKSGQKQWTKVDLQLTNYHVLLQAGVKAEHIDTSTSHCTKCNPHLYFSYERDDFPFGNQIGFICMPSSASRPLPR